MGIKQTQFSNWEVLQSKINKNKMFAKEDWKMFPKDEEVSDTHEREEETQVKLM